MLRNLVLWLARARDTLSGQGKSKGLKDLEPLLNARNWDRVVCGRMCLHLGALPTAL